MYVVACCWECLYHYSIDSASIFQRDSTDGRLTSLNGTYLVLHPSREEAEKVAEGYNWEVVMSLED